jgi:hypothetical protein
MRRHSLDALCLTQVYAGFKFWPSVLKTVGPQEHQRVYAVQVLAPSKDCPSARRASAANVICRDADVLGARKVLLNYLL